jgi:cytochrome c biogenesis protein CcmG, thiol:disulfide interchange protein DsbE
MRTLLRRTYACATLAMVALCLSAASASASASAAELLDLAQLRGKVVLVDFWASWCEPCRHSFPWLNEMQAKYGDRLVVIGVNVDRERADADRFLAQVPAHFKVIYDPQGELASQYDVMGMPSSFVFDTSGTLVDQHIGFRKAQRVEREEQLRKLLPPTLLQSRTNQ